MIPETPNTANHNFFSDLKGKTAIITGATRGIGFAIANLFGLYGLNVVITGRKRENVDLAVERLKNQKINCLGKTAHSGKPADLKNLIDETIETFKSIDIIVNNAATNPSYGPVLKTEDAVFEKILNVNLKGVFSLCKLAHPHLKKTKGSIINISSIDGLRPETNRGLYGVSKAALNALTKVLGKELGKDGIRVNSLCPGIIKTDFSKLLWTELNTKNNVNKKIPIGRLGIPDDIANCALFLASEKSSYATGTCFTVDGGYLL